MVVEIVLEVPDELAHDAQEFGLLNNQVVVQLLREEVDRRVNDLVNKEIHDYRAEKRANQKSD